MVYDLTSLNNQQRCFVTSDTFNNAIKKIKTTPNQIKTTMTILNRLNQLYKKQYPNTQKPLYDMSMFDLIRSVTDLKRMIVPPSHSTRPQQTENDDKELKSCIKACKASGYDYAISISVFRSIVYVPLTKELYLLLILSPFVSYVGGSSALKLGLD